MSCNKVNNCKKYKMNIGNPNDWENPCNRCNYNISDYDIGYNKAIDDFKKMLTIEKIKEYAESDGFININNCSLMIFDIAEQLKAGGRE